MYIDAKFIFFACILKHGLQVVIMIAHQTIVGVLLSLMEYSFYKLYKICLTYEILEVTSLPICLDSIYTSHSGV